MSISVSGAVFRQVGTDTSLAGFATASIAAFTTLTVTGSSGSLTSITINGVEILGDTVTYVTSTANTAALIVAQINTYSSTHKAFRTDDTGSVVTIQTLTGGTVPNGHALVITGTLTTTNTGALAGGGSTGATVTSLTRYSSYDLGTNRLSIYGTLTISTAGTYEQLVIAGDDNHDNIDLAIRSGAILNIGNNTSLLESNRNFSIPSILEKRATLTSSDSTAFTSDGAGMAGAKPFLWVAPGGTMNGWNRSISISGGWGQSATATMTLVDFEVLGLDMTTYLYGTYTFTRVTTTAAFSLVSTLGTLSAVSIYSTAYLGISATTPTAVYSVVDLPELRSGQTLTAFGQTSFNAGFALNFYNLTLGTAYSYGLTSGRYLAGTLYKRVNPTIKDSAGSPIQNAIVWCRGKTAMTPITLTTDANGTGLMTIPLGTYAISNGVLTTTFNGINNNNTDTFDFRVYVYGYQIGTLPVQTLKGTGNLSLLWTEFADVNLTLSKANAITKLADFTVDTGTSTITVNANSTLDELYDAMVAYKMTSNVTVPTIDDLLIEANGTTLTAYTGWNITVGVGVTLSNGSKFKSLSTTGTISGTLDVTTYIDTNGTFVKISVTGLISGSRIQLYNVTDASEIANAVASGTTYSQYVQYTSDKTLRVRATKNGFFPFERIATLSLSMSTILVDQQVDTIYNLNSIDGSTITTLTFDSANIQIDADEVDNYISVQEIYAWYVNELTTDEGIRTLFGAITAESNIKYRVNTSIANIKIDQQDLVNTLMITGGLIYRDDGESIRLSGSGSIEMIPDEVYQVETGISGLTLEESQQLANLTLIKAKTDLLPSDPAKESTSKTILGLSV